MQIHHSTIKNDVMSMEPVKSVALPASKAVTLTPQGYHVMLIQAWAPATSIPTTTIVMDQAADIRRLNTMVISTTCMMVICTTCMVIMWTNIVCR